MIDLNVGKDIEPNEMQNMLQRKLVRDVAYTCLCSMIAAFFSILTAQCRSDSTWVANRTRPKDPVPSVTPTSKSFMQHSPSISSECYPQHSIVEIIDCNIHKYKNRNTYAYFILNIVPCLLVTHFLHRHDHSPLHSKSDQQFFMPYLLL